MAESCKLEEVIIKAIPEIREKGHKKPTINTITKRLEQENCSYSEGEIKEAVERLIRRGQEENRGKNGEESLYVVTPDVLQKHNPCPMPMLSVPHTKNLFCFGHKWKPS